MTALDFLRIRDSSVIGPQHFKLLIVLLLIVLSATSSFASEEQYTVSYAGVPVVNVSIKTETGNNYWFGKYHAWVKKGVALFYSVDNTYHIKAQPRTWHPLSYTKTIHEGSSKYNLTFLYDQTQNTETFPNGHTVAFPDSAYNLFSAMLWVQHHTWTVGEERTLLVEIDGRIWTIEIVASQYDTYLYHDSSISVMRVEITFGTPQNSTVYEGRKDILSRELPQPGRKLIFWVDSTQELIYQIQVPMQPFSIWARLN